MDGWDTFSFPFGAISAYFQGRCYVSFRDGLHFHVYEPKRVSASHGPGCRYQKAYPLVDRADDPNFLRSRLCVPKKNTSLVNISTLYPNCYQDPWSVKISSI